ncbi:MAG: N-acetyltransferase [Lachnospirales bacterium]
MKDLKINAKFIEINLNELLLNLGEDRTKNILSSFECPLNKDVERFLKEKAIEFSKQGISRTHLVYWYSNSDKWGEEKELVGYYAIAHRSLIIHKSAVSNGMWKKIIKHGKVDAKDGKCIFSALLIGQLGKNFANGNNYLIEGNELLELALNKIRAVQNEIGGKITYLECEDNEKLIEFYENNGFTSFGKRALDGDETDIKGEHLIQLLQYLKG